MKFSLGKPKPPNKLMTSVIEWSQGGISFFCACFEEENMLTSLALVFLVGLSMAAICQKIKLPRIIGMLITGILLGPYALNWLDPSILSISSDLRQMALIIILLKAGLSLNLADLKKVGRPAVMMACVPASFEILAFCLFAPCILGITRVEAAVMGAVLGAVSPAVVIPRMVHLMETQYGTDKSIPQMIMACAIKIKSVAFVSKRLSEKFGKLWLAAEVILFVMVGAAVDIRYTLHAGLAAILMIALALVIRALGVCICLLRTPLNAKERLFCVIAYLPKATVQAAIGSVPLAMGLPCGQIVLSVAVLAILITAPLGATGIDMTYQTFLVKGSKG